MSKFLKIAAISLLTIIVSLTVLIKTVDAKVIQQERYELPKDQVIDDDLFVAGENIRIEGTVNGDVYVAGGLLEIMGTVNGDLMAAGGNIEIGGSVKQDIRVAGGNININAAKIGGSVSVFGGNVSIDEVTTIGGGLVFGTGMLNSKATIARGITGGGGDVNISGQVGKDVEIGAGEVTIASNANIGGNLTYYSENVAEIRDGSKVTGETKHVETSIRDKRNAVTNFSHAANKLFTGFRVWSFLATALVGIVFLFFFPVQAENIASQILMQPGRSLGWGFVVFIVTPIIAVILVATLIGLPLAIILMGLYFLELYLTHIISALLIGRWLMETLKQSNPSRYIKFVLGLLVLYLLISTPFLGFFVGTASIFFALGAIFIYKRKLLQNRANV